MAIIKRGILGGVLGKVGNVVGSSWKGIDVLKSLPLSVANPRTAGQVAQRTKMTNIVAFSKAILTSVIKPLNDRFAQFESGYNLFVSRNIALFTGVAPSPAANLVIAQGTVTPPAGFVNDTIENGNATCAVHFTDNTGQGDALGSDVLYGFAYNETKKEFGSVDAMQREDALLGTTITFPSNVATGNVIRLYFAYRRADGTKVSNTLYATVTAS
jgi:hypothetical protein